MSIPIMRVQRVVDPSDRLFNRAGVQVSQTSQQRLVLTVGRNHAVLDLENVLALMNKLQAWVNENSPEMEFRAAKIERPESLRSAYDEPVWEDGNPDGLNVIAVNEPFMDARYQYFADCKDNSGEQR